MEVGGNLVDWLVDIDPGTYTTFMSNKNSKSLIYLEISLKNIYGMLATSMFLYWNFTKDLEVEGFVFNFYDPCASKMSATVSRHTVRCHVKS